MPVDCLISPRPRLQKDIKSTGRLLSERSTATYQKVWVMTSPSSHVVRMAVDLLRHVISKFRSTSGRVAAQLTKCLLFRDSHKTASYSKNISIRKFFPNTFYEFFSFGVPLEMVALRSL
jgi:hypothetical protein